MSIHECSHAPLAVVLSFPSPFVHPSDRLHPIIIDYSTVHYMYSPKRRPRVPIVAFQLSDLQTRTSIPILVEDMLVLHLARAAPFSVRASIRASIDFDLFFPCTARTKPECHVSLFLPSPETLCCHRLLPTALHIMSITGTMPLVTNAVRSDRTRALHDAIPLRRTF